MRRTIAGECVFEGVGVHSGARARAVLHPSDGGGIVFSVRGSTWPVRRARRGETRRSTEIVFPDGSTLRTVEHFMSALAGMEIDDAVIECSGEELPILDGSAAPIVDRIREAGTRETEGERSRAAVSIPVVAERGRSFAAAFPSQDTSFTYIIDYPGTAIGTQMFDEVLTAEVYAERIAPAHTFALASEIETLRRSGLALGGTLDNALLVGEDGVEGGPLRVPHEFAAHKVLDLIGDLALLGSIPRARYVCAMGGHALHGMLADRLRSLVGAGQ